MSPIKSAAEKAGQVNVNTLILTALTCLSGWHLKKMHEGLDKINGAEKTIAVMDSQITDIKEKQKERDTQWERLEKSVHEIRINVAARSGQ